MSLKMLRAQRETLAREMRGLVESRPGALWNAAAQRLHDRKLAQLEHLDDQIAIARRAAEGADVDRLLDTTIRARSPDPAFAAFARHGQILNVMSTGTGSQGGFTVSSDVSARFVDTLRDFSGVRRLAEVIVTEKGNTLPWPTSNGTSEVGELVAENASATDLDPTFGSAPLPTYRYSSKVFTAPIELLQDSGIDLEGFIFTRAAARIGRLSNTHFTIGTGTGQPQGFATAAVVGKTGTTGQTTSVTHDDLVDLVHSVNAAYRQDPRGGVGFQMSDVAFRTVRKLKDTAGRPLYLPSDGVSPESLLGYPVIINDDVPAPAANAKSIVFGNFREGYKVRDALQVSLFRFTDSAYSSKGQVAFLAFARSGGSLVDAAAIRAYQHSAT